MGYTFCTVYDTCNWEIAVSLKHHEEIWTDVDLRSDKIESVLAFPTGRCCKAPPPVPGNMATEQPQEESRGREDELPYSGGHL